MRTVLKQMGDEQRDLIVACGHGTALEQRVLGLGIERGRWFIQHKQ